MVRWTRSNRLNEQPISLGVIWSGVKEVNKGGGMAVMLRNSAGILVVLALLAACSEKEILLTGERYAVLDDAAPVARAVSFEAPAPVSNASWTHRNGSASHRVAHPALGTNLSLVWSADIGAGNDRKHRISADPVVLNGRIFAMDSQSRVSAVTSSGDVLWTKDMVPDFDDGRDAAGGGLAAVDDAVFVTTGFGTLSSLDAATGDVRWTQRVDGALSGAPTVYGDLVYMVARDGTAWAIRKDNGRIAWSIPGVPGQAGMTASAAPAVTDQVAIFPFGSGDLVASFPRGGVRLWAASLSGARVGRAYTLFSDITGDPVIDGEIVYSGTSGGRTAAFNTRSGERLWTAAEGAMSPVWPAGGSVYSVTDESRLVRLDAETGETIWSVDLPYFRKERPKKRDEIYPHFGPVLAGGLLRVASGDGVLRSFSPETGALQSEVDLPGGAASGVAVAAGTLYVVSEKGKLHAFR